MWKTYGWRRNKREIELNCLKGSFGKKKTVEMIEKVSLCLPKREKGKRGNREGESTSAHSRK